VVTHADDAFEITMLDVFGATDCVPNGHEPDEPISFPLSKYRDDLARNMEALVLCRLDRVRLIRVKEEVDDTDWVNEGDGEDESETESESEESDKEREVKRVRM
jgi:hypothetical protein